MAFELDVALMKMKETDLRDGDGGGGDLGAGSRDPAVKTSYLRVAVLEAQYLPKMDDAKESYSDTYVRCTLQASGTSSRAPTPASVT